MRVESTQFIKDNIGNKIFAIIPMKEYNSFLEYQKYQKEVEIMEDFEDIRDAELRKNEKSYPANEVFTQIKAKRNGRS